MIDEVNLVPKNVLIRQVIRKSLRMWIGIWLASIALFLSGALIAWNHYSELLRSSRDIQTQAAPIQKLKEQVVQMRTELAEFKEREKLLLTMGSNHSPTSLIGLVSQATQAADSKVRVRELHIESIVQHATSAADSTPVSDIYTFSVQGYGMDDSSVSAFVGSLRDSQFFSEIHLRSSIVEIVDGKQVKAFSLACQIN